MRVQLHYIKSSTGDSIPSMILPAGATEQDSEFVRRWLDEVRSPSGYVTVQRDLRKAKHSKPRAFDMLRHQIKQNNQT